MNNYPTVQQLFDLTGKVFLVIGGARHLGRDMAVAFAEAGAHGVVTSRDDSAACETALEIGKNTQKSIRGLQLDATDEPSVENLFHIILTKFGRIDIVVNAVGGGALQATSAHFEDATLEDWERMHQTNLTAVFLVCKYAARSMKKQRSGAIINIASIAGVIGRDRRVYPQGMSPQAVSYASAKAGVIGFSRDLAADLGNDGIRVNTISPGGFQRNQPEAFIKAYSDKVPLGRMGQDGIDLKGAALFLASDASSYVTGHNLIVDGGFTIWQ